METNLAVLIDFENIAAGTEKEGLGRFDVENLMRHIKDKGRILVARSYADWGRFSRFKQSLLAANVTMMELTSHGMQDKNRADIAMVVDALELAFTKHYVDTFVVVSGDSDFTPMVLKMRELNKRVIGIGTRKSTSRLLIQACDEFSYYETIVQPKQRSRRAKPRAKTDERAKAFDLLEEALDGLQRQNPDPPLASVVKSAMLRKSPDFSENELGFGSFARFLETAQEAGVVQIIRDTKSGGYRVDSSEAEPPPEAPSVEEVPETKVWSDTYMPDEAADYVDALAKVGLHPLAAPTRLAVLEALEEVVAERKKRRRKTTLKFVIEDIQKKLRRTHPDLPTARLQGLLDGLLQAGELIHRDGTAIRSSTAPFGLNKDAEALNHALVRLFLAQLKEQGADMARTGILAELMYGDRDRKREIEETLAYLVAQEAEEDLDLDLDDLLVPAETKKAEPKKAEPKKAEPKKAEAKKEPEPEPTLEAAPEAEAEAEAAPEPEPKKKTTRTRTRKKAEPKETAAEKKKKAAAKKEEEPKAEAEAASAEEEPKPKKRVRRRAKKAEEPKPEDSDLDALLTPQPGPGDVVDE